MGSQIDLPPKEATSCLLLHSSQERSKSAKHADAKQLTPSASAPPLAGYILHACLLAACFPPTFLFFLELLLWPW